MLSFFVGNVCQVFYWYGCPMSLRQVPGPPKLLQCLLCTTQPAAAVSSCMGGRHVASVCMCAVVCAKRLA